MHTYEALVSQASSKILHIDVMLNRNLCKVCVCVYVC